MRGVTIRLNKKDEIKVWAPPGHRWSYRELFRLVQAFATREQRKSFSKAFEGKKRIGRLVSYAANLKMDWKEAWKKLSGPF